MMHTSLRLFALVALIATSTWSVAIRSDDLDDLVQKALNAAGETSNSIKATEQDASESARLSVASSAEYSQEVMDKSLRGVRGGVVNAEAQVKNPCSGHGTLDDSGSCKCFDDYMGPTCALKLLTDGHQYGRYVGEKRCENGVSLDNSCDCDAGWEGYHCHRRACIHGSFKCPDDSKYCMKATCVCDDGWEGATCDTVKKECVPKQCKNTGVFDMDSCECKCEKPWTGELCEKCMPRNCPNGMVQDPNNCGCICPKTKKCTHGGLLDMDTCSCNCTANWAGPTCDQCVKQECYNGGIFNEQECTCECMPPYDPASNCKTCPELDCRNGGKFIRSNCSCSCPGLWTGDTCEECPSEEEIALKGIDCGGRGFNRETCSCNDECLPKDCAHGGRQDPDTCECRCNVQNDALEKQGVSATGSSEDESSSTGAAPDIDTMEPRAAVASNKTHEKMFGGDGEEDDEKKDDEANQSDEMSFVEFAIGAATGSASGEGPGEAGLASKPTFWGGDRCEMCKPPEGFKCPNNRSFNDTTCMCNDDCSGIKCENGGTLDKDACECACPPPWAGQRCNKKASGKAKILAGVSCKAILTEFPDSPNGKYWINPSGKAPSVGAFEVACDMKSDTGGWVRFAKIGSKLREVKLDGQTYREGVGSPDEKEFILPCDKLAGLDGAKGATALTSFIMRVTMGEVKDYYRPVKGANLCDMLTSKDKHEWSATGGVPPSDEEEEGGDDDEGKDDSASFLAVAATMAKHLRTTGRQLLGQETEEAGADGDSDDDEDDGVEWRAPDYVADPRLSMLLGGSDKGYAVDIDGREYLSFWGGDKGGCCHYASEIYGGEADSGSWGREFELHVIEVNQSGDSDDEEGDGEGETEDSGTGSAADETDEADEGDENNEEQ